MNDQQLQRSLNSIGKRCFVKYFEEFRSSNDVAALLEREEGYTFKACRSRTSHAKSIIKARREQDALDIIIRSKADALTKNKAAAILARLRA